MDFPGSPPGKIGSFIGYLMPLFLASLFPARSVAMFVPPSPAPWQLRFCRQVTADVINSSRPAAVKFSAALFLTRFKAPSAPWRQGSPAPGGEINDYHCCYD